ncbi:MAG: hypothetical protein J2P17_25885 [Mycobacterium sp.]|nr:hypothetical protein [Mycobacterium sp.]
MKDTSVQRAVIDRVPDVLVADDRILAAWLVDSFATGRADAYSDIDLHCLITDESAGSFRGCWRDTATALIRPLVLAQDIPGIIGGYTITPDWLHLDLILHPRSQLDPKAVPGLLPLYDRAGDMLPTKTTPKAIFGEPYFPERPMAQFLYFVGNLPVLIARGERMILHGSVTGFRDVLISLMLAERGIRDRGGAKRLDPFLTSEQRQTLESLPTVSLDDDQILEAIHVVTRVIRHRAKQLAARTDATWPQELEDAALRRIRSEIGVDFT